MRAGRWALGATLLVLGAGCASSTEWEDEPVRRPTPRRGAALAAAEEPADLRAWAARFRTANMCEVEARRALVRDAQAGLRRILACSEREDFDVLEPLLHGRWPSVLRVGSTSFLPVLRALSRRGAVGADVKSIRLAGFPVHSLEEGLEAEPGAMVIFLGAVEQTSPTLLVGEIGVDTPEFMTTGGRRYVWVTTYAYDHWGRLSGVRSGVETRGVEGSTELQVTGRNLRLQPSPRCRVERNEVRLFLVRMRGAPDESGPSADPLACILARAPKAE